MTPKQLLFIILIALVLTSASCRKEKKRTFHVWGKILSQYDNSPIEGDLIRVYSQDAGNRIGTKLIEWEAGPNWGYDPLIASGYSDANGNFDMTYEDYDKTKQRAIITKKDGYAFYTDVMLGGEGDKGIIYEQPLYHYKVRVKNATPYNSNDSLFFTSIPGKITWLRGMNIDSTFTISEMYLYNIIVEWHIYKDNVSPYPKKNSATLHCKPFDTCSYSIDY